MNNKYSEKHLIKKANTEFELETAYELGVKYQNELMQFQMEHKDYIQRKKQIKKDEPK